ncbi:SoxR reducing system RseC family protein, partial [Patescibacteria group bacterium]|nr:SoxR reducing system RseC family protein [Patescibacteria group bacterium]
DFSFIASWITNANLSNTSTAKQRGIVVEFPTDKIFYPLKPTSVYGQKRIPTEIRIIGYVSPQIFPNIKDYTNVEYYHNLHNPQISSLYKSMNLTEFGEYYDSSKDFDYTLIKINAPSDQLTQDLSINSFKPSIVYLLELFAFHPIIAATLIIILFSFIIGAITGRLLFGRSLLWGKIGLSNILSLLGMLFVMLYFARPKNIKEEDKTLIDELKQKKIFAIKAWNAILSIVFLIIYLIPLLFAMLFGTLFDMPSYVLLSPQFIIYLLIGVALFLIIYKLGRILANEKNLTKQLFVKGYSYFEIAKYYEASLAYIVLFSMLFVIISYPLFVFIQEFGYHYF